MITYGFFDSVDGDRVYNADQMSNYFKGLITDGVYQSVGTAMKVSPGTGMSVQVGAGRAIINCKWLNNSGVLQVDISPAHTAFPRYTTVAVRLDEENRTISIVTHDGSASATPTPPAPVRSGAVYELILAQIYIPPNSTQIYESNIRDTRPNGDLCGWVAALVQNLDTAELFNQWTAAYNEQYEAFSNAFTSWFSQLTETLNVDTYIQKFSKTINALGTSTVIVSDISGYEFEGSDIFMVFINGLKLSDDEFQVIESGEGALHMVIVDFGFEVSNGQIEVVIFKSVIGHPV